MDNMDGGLWSFKVRKEDTVSVEYIVSPSTQHVARA